MLIFRGGMKVKNDKPRNDPKLEPNKYLRKMLNRFWQIQLATEKTIFTATTTEELLGLGWMVYF